MRISLPALLLLVGCTLRSPTPTGIPFVSTQLLGHWVGRWSVPLPGQVGDADVVVTREPDQQVSWKMSLDGGLLSGADEPPLLYDLRGADDLHAITLTGDGPKLGPITLHVDEVGLISGTAEPGGIAPVDIVGMVGEDFVRLDFVVLSLLHGRAVVTLEGAPAPEDTGAVLEPLP